jgi:hypothetical protein
MKCNECGAELVCYVDFGWGIRESSVNDVMRSKVAPKRIEHRMSHELWCTNYNAAMFID